MPAFEELWLQQPVVQSFLRGTATYLGAFFLFRIVGRREAGGLSTNDILVVVLAVQALGVGLTGAETDLADGFVVVATILFWTVVLDALAYFFPRLRPLIKSTPSLLVENGKLQKRAMRRELMEIDELLSHLRLHGVESLDQVERAYLEPNGMISVVRRDHKSEELPTRPLGGP